MHSSQLEHVLRGIERELGDLAERAERGNADAERLFWAACKTHDCLSAAYEAARNLECWIERAQQAEDEHRDEHATMDDVRYGGCQ